MKNVSLIICFITTFIASHFAHATITFVNDTKYKAIIRATSTAELEPNTSLVPALSFEYSVPGTPYNDEWRRCFKFFLEDNVDMEVKLESRLGNESDQPVFSCMVQKKEKEAVIERAIETQVREITPVAPQPERSDEPKPAIEPKKEISLAIDGQELLYGIKGCAEPLENHLKKLFIQHNISPQFRTLQECKVNGCDMIIRYEKVNSNTARFDETGGIMKRLKGEHMKNVKNFVLFYLINEEFIPKMKDQIQARDLDSGITTKDGFRKFNPIFAYEESLMTPCKLLGGNTVSKASWEEFMALVKKLEK